MIAKPQTLFITGATGLVGGDVLERMLRADPTMRAYALVRGAAGECHLRSTLGALAARVVPVRGDLLRRGLGIDYEIRKALTREVTMVVHAAADTTFSRSLAESRMVNREGTRQLLSLCRAIGSLRRFSYVSTSYVAGRALGLVLERDNGVGAGWVNAYERSKYEAEALVRESSLDWVIFRPSTIVCDAVNGRVSQVNAVHRALKVYNRGLAAMMPGERNDTLDVVPADYVSDAIARVTLDPHASAQTLHLCAGAGAISIGDLLDVAYDLWATDPMWKRRGIERAVLADLATYNLFAEAVRETGDHRLASILQSLSHFIPQLALPKQFDTRIADALVGHAAPAVSSYWASMLAHLLASNWGTARKAA
ncbi:MAG: SDR family oxidoreductase [Gemmatimonadales bacterium]